MKLRGIEFGQVFCAPGARGFFGEGYPFHKLWKWLGMNWQGSSLVTKTTTLNARPGNLPLKDDGLTPQELFPKCIAVNFKTGHVANIVSLSGVGLEALLRMNRWQKMTEPFMISFMSVATTAPERLEELKQTIQILKNHKPTFKTKFALQINFACPNVGLTHGDNSVWIAEILKALDIASELDVPEVANFNSLTDIEVLQKTANHPACDALWPGNAMPGVNPDINWKKLFGTHKSPLMERGYAQPGGLSGPFCLPYTIEIVKKARAAGITKPIVAGNGIQSVDAAREVFRAGADGIALGVIGIVRPWRLQGVIHFARTYPVRARELVS